MAELAGPNNCAECGTETPLDMCLNGDADSLVIPFGDELIEIPGLYVCTGCAGAIMVGERERTVTPERAVEFLTKVYIPLLATHMTYHQNEMAVAYNRFLDCAEAAGKLDPSMSVSLGVIELD